MSFSNPVNESVLRFKSTDAGAPQIDYNSRVAGDVKAVLKACLVTGYGDKSSAGWSIASEVEPFIEFVSPSPAMSDYKLKVDDSSGSYTYWYYMYQGVESKPYYYKNDKRPTYIDKTSPINGWQLLVTSRGFVFIDIAYSSSINAPICNITYWGQIKSALTSTDDRNMSFWSTGFISGVGDPASFLQQQGFKNNHYLLNGATTNLGFAATNLNILTYLQQSTTSNVELTSELYITRDQEIIAQQPGILIRNHNGSTGLYKIEETSIDGRPALYICVATSVVASVMRRYSVPILIYLDYWGY